MSYIITTDGVVIEGGHLQVTVTRDDSQQDEQVTWSSRFYAETDVNNRAAEEADLASPTSGTLTFKAGQNQATLEIITTDDNYIEAVNEIFLIGLNTPDGIVTSEIAIEDNDRDSILLISPGESVVANINRAITQKVNLVADFVAGENYDFTYEALPNQALTWGHVTIYDPWDVEIDSFWWDGGTIEAEMTGRYRIEATADYSHGDYIFSLSTGKNGAATILDSDGSLWDARIQAGDGTIIEAVDAQVYRAYYGAMGRLPDKDGYDWWLEQIKTGQHNLQSMATGFMHSDEFSSLADTDKNNSISNEELIQHMYTGVFSRAPDQAGLDWWLSRLDGGEIDQPGAFIDMTQSNEYVEATYVTVADLLFL